MLSRADDGDGDGGALPAVRRIELVEGEAFAPFELAAAGFRSLRPLIGRGKVTYIGVRDDHHVFEHVSGVLYEPVSRLRTPGPRGSSAKTRLHLDCGVLTATFTDADHVWVSTPRAGLWVKESTVFFSFHYHRGADGRWAASAWDPGHVRPVTSLFAAAPLGCLRHLAEVILPAIAAGLADRETDTVAQPANRASAASDPRGAAEGRDRDRATSGRQCPRLPSFGIRVTRRLAFVVVVALAVVGLGATPLAASLTGARSSLPSVTETGPAPDPVSPGPDRSSPTHPPTAPDIDGSSAAPAVPARSGVGRRIVYCNSCQRVWLVESDGYASRSYRVSGRTGRPRPGTYSVQSRSERSGSASGMRLDHMVRFTKGRDLWIGFHAIPVGPSGPVQAQNQLGHPLSQGCIRQAPDDARALWDFAPVGTAVVVLA